MILRKRLLAGAAALMATMSAPGAAAVIIGGNTDVTLTAAPTLAGLGLSAAPVGSASVVLDSAGISTFSFPITSGTVDDGTGAATLFHNGSGILFTAGSSTLQIGDFVVDTGSLTVLGNAIANGTRVGVVPLFTIGSGLSLSLTSQAAGAFTTVFQAPDLTGTNVGFANPQPVTAAVPEPSTWAMMLLGFGAIGFALRARRRQSYSVSYS